MWVTDVVLATKSLMLKLEWLEKSINHCELEFFVPFCQFSRMGIYRRFLLPSSHWFCLNGDIIFEFEMSL